MQTEPADNIYFSVKKRTQSSNYHAPRQFKETVVPKKFKNVIQPKKGRTAGTPKDFALTPKLLNKTNNKLQAVANKRKAMKQAREPSLVAPSVPSHVQEKYNKATFKKYIQALSKSKDPALERIAKYLEKQPDKYESIKLPLDEVISKLSSRLQDETRQDNQLMDIASILRAHRDIAVDNKNILQGYLEQQEKSNEALANNGIEGYLEYQKQKKADKDINEFLGNIQDDAEKTKKKPSKGKKPTKMRQALQDAGQDVTEFANLNVPPVGMTKKEMMEKLRDTYDNHVQGKGLDIGHLYGGAFANDMIQKHAKIAMKHGNPEHIEQWKKVAKASKDALNKMNHSMGNVLDKKKSAQLNKEMHKAMKGGSFTSAFNSFADNFWHGLAKGATLGLLG
jgi:hypothetical protein